MRSTLLTLAAVAATAPALGQSVTIYGRVDLSVAQQAAAAKNLEIRNGSGSRLGVRGVEELGGGWKALFQIEHRFNAQDGSIGARFWEGKSVVGIEGSLGRLLIGREENPAYTLSQVMADPWGTDTVASNGSIVNGRIGTTRYSNTLNLRSALGPVTLGAQVGEASGSGNLPAGTPDKRPYSLGASYASGPLFVGVGYENPPDADDFWMTATAAYTVAGVRVAGLVGTGSNAADQKHRAWLLSATAALGGGELRASVGELKNRSVAVNPLKDRQLSLGYHHALSKRTTLYADLVNKRPDGLAANLRKTGYDLGLKHNF